MPSIVSGVIEKILTGGSSGTIHAIASTAYGYCETAASEQYKNVDMTGFKLEEGVTIHVKFANTNSASSPKLKFNDEANTEAKPIILYGTTTASWDSGAVLTLTYDGASWIRDLDTNNKVSLTVVGNTYTNWRPLLIGASSSATEGFSPASTTDGAYTTSSITVLPSTGTIRATTFKGNADSATQATKLGSSNLGSERQLIYLAEGTATAGNYIFAHRGNAGKTNMNDIGKLWPSTGMTNLTSTSNVDTPKNGSTYSSGWHLYWDTSYTENPGGSNSWVAQIVNKAGSNSWWVRSRAGSTITNGTAWASNWRHLVTSTEETVGNSATPVYINENGEATACTDCTAIEIIRL